MTAHTIVVDVGAAMGPLLAFTVIDLYGITLIYYVSGLLLITLGVTWMVYIRRSQRGTLD